MRMLDIARQRIMEGGMRLKDKLQELESINNAIPEDYDESNIGLSFNPLSFFDNLHGTLGKYEVAISLKEEKKKECLILRSKKPQFFFF